MKRLAALFPAALILLAPAAFAAEADAPPVTEDELTTKAVATRLHDEAADIRRTAEADYATAQKECWRKFLVSRCLDQAGQTYRDEKLKASTIDSRARAMERDLKRRQIAEKDAKRAEQEAAKAGKQ